MDLGKSLATIVTCKSCHDRCAVVQCAQDGGSMTHYEFEAVFFEGRLRYPMFSDFGRVCQWGARSGVAGKRRTIKPRKGSPYARVKMKLKDGSQADLGVASLVLNAFAGKPDEGYTAVSACDLCCAVPGESDPL